MTGHVFCGVISLKKILGIIQKIGKGYCFALSAVGFSFGCMILLTQYVMGGMSSDFVKIFEIIGSIYGFVIGAVFLAAALYDSDQDKDNTAKRKAPRFYTVNEDGNIVLTGISDTPPLNYTEKRREDGKVDIFMQIHSKEQATEVLAALAVMYDKGDIADVEYRRTVRQIREYFDL